MEQSIKIKIDSKELSLKVKSPEDEARYRRAAKEINEKIDLYRSKYPNNSIVDFLSMTALLFAIKSLELDHRIKTDPIYSDIRSLTLRLEEYLNNDNI